MPRLTVSLDEEQAALLEKKVGDGGEYESKSEAVRDFIRRGEEAKKRIEELEQTVERLENEKRLILEERAEKQELVRYVETERNIEQRWREAPLGKRLKWKLFGMPADATADDIDA